MRATLHLRVAACLAISLLWSCGGGGGGGGGSKTVANQSVGGIWQGQVTTSSGATVAGNALVDEAGRFYFEAQNQSNGCAEVGTGSLSVNGANVTGSDQTAVVVYSTVPGLPTNCTFADGSTSGSGTLSGTVVQRSTLSLNGNFTTSTGTVYPAGPLSLSFNSLYDEPSSVSKFVGTWTGPTGIQSMISSSGATFAQDPVTGCTVNGQISVINSSFNVYLDSGTYSNCLGSASQLNGITASGLLTLDDRGTPNELIGGATVRLSPAQTIIVVADAVNVSTSPITPPTAVPLATAIAYKETNGLSANAVIRGSLSGINITGSALISETPASAATFDGGSALSQTTTITGSVTEAGAIYPINSTAVGYTDGSYDTLGVSNATEYDVASVPIAYPATVSVGDSGTLGTLNRFTDSTQTVSLGTTQISFLVVADTASSSDLIFETIETQYDTSDNVSEIAQTYYKITTAGIPTLASLSVLTSTGYLLYTAQ